MIDAKEYLSIVGPRQVGKTTLLNRLREDLLNIKGVDSEQVLYLTFQDPLELQSFDSNPVRYINDKIIDKDKKTYFLIDEYQYSINGGSKLKLIYDTVANIKVIITGSSSLELREVGASMVGRMFQYYLNHLTYLEALSNQNDEGTKKYKEISSGVVDFLINGTAPNIVISPITNQKILEVFNVLSVYGSYPAVFLSKSAKDMEERIGSIYISYIEKDIIRLLQLGGVDKFTNLIKYMSLTIGQQLNMTSIQNDLNITYRELDKDLNILEQTYILDRIVPYSSNKVREITKTPIYYFKDIGLRNSMLRSFSDLDVRPDIGHYIENIVCKRLNDIILSNNIFGNIHFWRTKSGAEVDFILERLGDNPTIIPIEVKYTLFKKEQLSKSFYSFIDEYSPKIGIVITKDFIGYEEIRGTKILFIPVHLF